MILPALTDFSGLLEPGARLMGLDLGAKRIGIALSDRARTLATPRETLRRRGFKQDMAALRAIVEREGVGGMVVGLPVNMDGSEGPRAQSARDYARALANALALPVAFWDERWSTLAVERVLVEADLSRGKRARVVDRAAAAYILQGALDRLRNAQGDARSARPRAGAAGVDLAPLDHETRRHDDGDAGQGDKGRQALADGPVDQQHEGR